MAHQMLKGYSFLLYFLSLIAGFFIGIAYAGFIEAAKHQGLAGGAIVLGYGVIGAVVALVISIFMANRAQRKTILILNIVLAIAIGCFWFYNHIKYLERKKARVLEKEQIQKPKKQTPTAPVDSDTEPMAMLLESAISQNSKNDGLGMFVPNLSENSKLYFYGNPNIKKAVIEHFPIDSITFKKTEYGGHEIATAPSWLVPDHLKLDYDILYFKVESVTQDFVEIRVNTLTNKTSFVNKYNGKIVYWPEFLLGVNSVEFLNPETQNIHIKPLEHSSRVSTPYSFMKPISITSDWMLVELFNEDFDTVGKGWIKWIKGNYLLISYSLLS